MSSCPLVHGISEVKIAQVEPKSTASPVKKWLHQHPTVQKTAIVALGTLGVKTLYDGLLNYSFYSVALGSALIGGAYLSDKIVPIIVPPTHDPSNRAYNQEMCRGVSLTYKGNLPILTIPKSVKPFDAGYARGYMMAPQIKDLLEKNAFAFHTIRGLPREIPHLIKEMMEIIPDEYLDELKGLVEGYNAKRESWYFLKGKELTLEDLIYFHLLPDYAHLDFKEADNSLQRSDREVVGCSVVVDGDQETGPRAIRVVDWIPMDVYGKDSFIECRENADGIKTVGQSFPVFVGALTAMNQHGLCGAINVARGFTDYPEKLPAVFYLRKLLENCHSVRGEKSAESFWNENSPLGPFNLSILDKEDAAGVHFYQGKNKSHHIRWWKEGSELQTLNFRYGEKGENNPTPSNSAQRKCEIQNYYDNMRDQDQYDQMDSSDRLKGVLKGPEVNNIRTISATYLDPRKKVFEISFDNGYAGDRPLLEVPVEEWFNSQSS